MIGMLEITGIIVSIIITLFLGVFLRSIFYSIVHPELKISRRKLFSEFKLILKLLKQKSIPSKKSESILYQYTPIIIFIFEIFISILIPITHLQNFSNWDFSIVFTILLLISINLVYILLNLTYKENIKIYTVNSQINLLARDFIPIIISVISIFIIFGYSKGDFNIPSFLDIIQFQNTYKIIILGMHLPAIFLIINPFAALSTLLSIINIFKLKSSNKLNTEIYNSWDPLIEFNGRTQGYSLIGESMKIFILSTFFIAVFTANGQFIIDDSFYSIVIYLVLLTLFVVFISFFCKRESTTITTKNFRIFFNPAMLLALFSLIFSEVIVYFGFIQIIPL